MIENSKKWQIFALGFFAAFVLFGTLYFFFNSGSPNQDAATILKKPDDKGIVLAKPTRAAIQLEAGQARAIDLRLTTVAQDSLEEDLRVGATVVPDESRISHIHTRVAGWIEKLHVANTGEMVRAGQPIADIYSQELLSSQIEYLAARELSGPPSAVLESGRNRLKFFGMSETEIIAIEKSGKPHRLVTLLAPRSGILAHRGIAIGTAVDPSTEIAVILDLSRVWVFAEVPEAASDSIRKGMTATLELGHLNKTGIPATVEFIDPLLTETTRALKVRFSLANHDGNLRPGTYGTAIFKSSPRTALTVPREALVDTGNTQYVYVMKTDDLVEPRMVRVGVRQKNKVEILQGLNEGERIVTSGVFLLDSESRLRASGNQGTAHSGHGKTSAAQNPAAVAAPAAAQSASQQHAAGARHD
ncbi:MAG: efflux RND transporter periplasmic adaptor subunit [Sideroxyarcus sp.]|nr:efflux RND transporter periplasmic adaptor subunit [Sideroxyarcus sp.]